ncbi:MAG: transcription termination factor Rho, partial [Chloroflexi bacterium]
EDELKQVWLLRRMAAMLEEDSGDAAERIIERLSRTVDNVEFLATLKGM